MILFILLRAVQSEESHKAVLKYDILKIVALDEYLPLRRSSGSIRRSRNPPGQQQPGSGCNLTKHNLTHDKVGPTIKTGSSSEGTDSR